MTAKLPHSFATHLLVEDYDIRAVQELVGHKDVEATMIDAHVLNKGAPRRAKSGRSRYPCFPIACGRDWQSFRINIASPIYLETMYLETLLLAVALPLILVLSCLHNLVVKPALKHNNIESRGVADILAHRDWKHYYHDCDGSTFIFLVLWVGYLIALSAVALQFAQFFFFPGIKL